VLSFGKLRDQNAQLGQVVRHLAMETLVYYRAVFVKFQQGGVDSLGEAKGRQQMTRYLTHQLGGVIPICKSGTW